MRNRKGSYADAPLLADGVYRDTIGSDDVRIVRVHLDWGQRFAYELNFGGRGAELADTVDVYATVRNPVREPVDSEQSAFGVGGDDASVSGATPVPVRYRNRESDDEDTAECDIAGDYYLVLRSDPADSGTSVRYSYSLRVQVFGKASGAPAYGSAGGSSSSGSSAGTTTPTSANTSSARTTPSGPVDAAGSGSDRTLVVAIVAGGAALLVVIVLVAVLGRRRRHG